MMPTIDIKSNDVEAKNGNNRQSVFNHILTKMESTLNDGNALLLKDPEDIKLENGNFCLDKEMSIDNFQSTCFGCQNLQKKLKISRGWNRFFKEKLLSYDKLLHIIGEYENEKKKNIELQLAYDQRSREWSHQQEQLITLYHEVQPLREKLKVAEVTAEEEKNLRMKHQYMEDSLKVTIQQLQAKVSHMTTIANPVFVENLEKKLNTSRSEIKKLKCNLEFKRTEVEELRSYISNKHVQVENLSKKLLWALQLANKYGADASRENTLEWETLQIQTRNILHGLKAQFNSFCETKQRELKGRRLELACLPSFSKWVTDFEICDTTKKSSQEPLETQVTQPESLEEIREVNHLEKLLLDVDVEEVFMNMSRAEFSISSEELSRPIPESKSFADSLKAKRLQQNIKKEKTDKIENAKVSKPPQIRQNATDSENNNNNSKDFTTSALDKATIKVEKILTKNIDQDNYELIRKTNDNVSLNKINTSSLPAVSSSTNTNAPTPLFNSMLSKNNSLKISRKSKKSTKESKKSSVSHDLPANENIHIFKNFMNKSLEISSQRVSSSFSKNGGRKTVVAIKKRRKIVSSEHVLSDSSSDTDSDDVPLTKVRNSLVGESKKLESNILKSNVDEEQLSFHRSPNYLATSSSSALETREIVMEKIKQIMETFMVPPLSHSPYSESTDSSSEVREKSTFRKPVVVKKIEKSKKKSQIPEINEENSFVPNRITRASRYRQKSSETAESRSSEIDKEEMHFLGLRRKITKSRISSDTESSSEKKEEMQPPTSTRKRTRSLISFDTNSSLETKEEMPCPTFTRKRIKSEMSSNTETSSEKYEEMHLPSSTRRTRSGIISDKETSLKKIKLLTSMKRIKSDITSDTETSSEQKEAPQSPASTRKKNKSETSLVTESSSVKKEEMQLPILKRRRTRSEISANTKSSLEQKDEIRSSASLKGKTKSEKFSDTDSYFEKREEMQSHARTRKRIKSDISVDTESDSEKTEEMQPPVSSEKRAEFEISSAAKYSAESSCMPFSTDRRRSLRNTRTRSVSEHSENIDEDTEISKEVSASVPDQRRTLISDLAITPSVTDSEENGIQICNSEVTKTDVKPEINGNSKNIDLEMVHDTKYFSSENGNEKERKTIVSMDTNNINDIDIAHDTEKPNKGEKETEISVSMETCNTDNTDIAHNTEPTNIAHDTEKPNLDNEKKIEINGSMESGNTDDIYEVHDTKKSSSDNEKDLETCVSLKTCSYDDTNIDPEKPSELSLLGLNLSDDSFEDKEGIDSDANSALSVSLNNDVDSLKIISPVSSSINNNSQSSLNVCDSGIFLNHSCDKRQQNDLSHAVTESETLALSSKQMVADNKKSISVTKGIDENLAQEAKEIKDDALPLESFKPKSPLRLKDGGLEDNLQLQETEGIEGGISKMKAEVIKSNAPFCTTYDKFEDSRELSNEESFETPTKEPKEEKLLLKETASELNGFSSNLIHFSQSTATLTPEKESVSSSDFSLILSDSEGNDDSESETKDEHKVQSKTTSKTVKEEGKAESNSDEEENSLVMDIDDEMHPKVDLSDSNSKDSFDNDNEIEKLNLGKDSNESSVLVITDFKNSVEFHDEVNNSGLTVESSTDTSASELNISESNLSTFSFYKERKDVSEQSGFEIPNIIFDEPPAVGKGIPSVDPPKKSKKKRKQEQIQLDKQNKKKHLSSQDPPVCLPQIRSHSDFQNLPATLEDHEMNSEELCKCFEDIIWCNFRSQEWNFLINKICTQIEDTNAPNLQSKLQPLIRVLLVSVLRSSPYEKRDSRFSVPPTIYKLFQIVRIIELNFRFPPFTVDSLVNVAAHKLILKKKLRPHSLTSLTMWVISSCYAQYNKLEAPLDEECVRWGRGFLIDLLFYHKDLISESLLAAINSSRKIFVRIVKYRESTVLEKIIFWVAHHGSWSGPKATKTELIEAFKHKLGLHNPPPEYPSELLKSILLVLINAEAEVDELVSTKAGFLLLLKWVPSTWIRKTIFPVLKDMFYDDVTINKHSLEYIKELFAFTMKKVQWSEEEEARFLDSLKSFPIIKS